MKLPTVAALLTPKILTGLAIALALSVCTIIVQHYSAAAAAAHCAAKWNARETSIATANAQAERERAEQIGALINRANNDETARLAALDAATQRIAGAANRYAKASTAKPLPPDCRATPDRVQAVNAARGYQ